MRCSIRSLLFSTAALAGALPAAAFADEPSPLGEVVVTATRLPSRLDLVTGAHVVDRAELEARQTPFLEDVLSTVPGVGVTRNGAFGGAAAIRIRGASPDKTLVLIDGVPVNDAADPNGTFDPSSLQTADVERIEVLNGPQGSLWGSDAIGGVVSITTRELTGLTASAEGGSFGTARGFVGTGVAEDRYAVSASLAGLRTDGISRADTGSEKDPYRTATANLAGRVRLTDWLQLDARLRTTYANIAIDGYPPPDYALADTPDRNKARSWQGDVRAIVDAFGLRQTASYGDYHLWRRNISDFPEVYTATRRVFRWTAEKGGPADAWAAVVGAERIESKADLSGRASTNLSVTSVFAVARARPWTPLNLTASLRFDDPDRFRSRSTGRLSAAVDVGAGFTLTASAGQGFKIPSISEVVCDYCFAPPVPLRPERAEGYDLRLGWLSPDKRIEAAVTGYRLAVRDQIAYQDLRYVNIARTRSTGLEAEADAQLTDALRLKLAYAHTKAIDATTGAELLRIPHNSGSAALFYNSGKWGGALTVRGESSQLDLARDGFSRERRKGFLVADLAGSYRLTDQVSLTARVENLADRRYEETLGFSEAGRAVYLGVRFRP